MKHYHHMTLDIFVSTCHCSVLSVTSVHQQHRLEYIKAMLISLTGSHITSQTLCLWLQSEQKDPPHVFLALPPSWPRSPGSDTVTVSQRAGISWRLISSETVRGNPPTLTGDWGIQLVTDTQTQRSFQVYLLHVFGPVRRLRHGHEATVGQDGAHDEQAE